MFTVIFIISCLIFGLAYLKYGKFLTRLFELDNRNKTPAHSMYTGTFPKGTGLMLVTICSLLV
ncbi:MAG: hypothetical protein KKC39_07935 [Candidatus Omnitrophica bacterium]|nr:hypothetical protein [Candidatus Omnitrophota bacterium]MBU4303317.1 hypothetical protein [Candidatus Omnitrophota bacterium]MBU4418943.1 hypothetical protein [Candidatus Omnitrophota bacterium]MBU4468647.1 hypothetical protein [Candidatus Omnitrophota bacterium]MCG2707538.1 hypothetical protein [Candidatus Omnitrophota bacterium]